MILQLALGKSCLNFVSFAAALGRTGTEEDLQEKGGSRPEDSRLTLHNRLARLMLRIPVALDFFSRKRHVLEAWKALEKHDP